jgi:hypothetical protein
MDFLFPGSFFAFLGLGAIWAPMLLVNALVPGNKGWINRLGSFSMVLVSLVFIGIYAVASIQGVAAPVAYVVAEVVGTLLVRWFTTSRPARVAASARAKMEAFRERQAPPPPPPPVVEEPRGLRPLPGVPGPTWARGERPNGAELDAESRIALETLWLADARREHGTGALISRAAWLLTAAGAPAELVSQLQRASAAKVNHAQTCFAIAAGYGRRTLGIEPRADLLRVPGRKGDLLSALATELLEGGCLVAQFRSDVAGARAAVCTEPIAREILTAIARDDATRAAISWSALRWLLETDSKSARRALNRCAATLPFVERPRWVPPEVEPWLKKQARPAIEARGVLNPIATRGLWEKNFHHTRRELGELLARDAKLRGAPPRLRLERGQPL